MFLCWDALERAKQWLKKNSPNSVLFYPLSSMTANSSQLHGSGPGLRAVGSHGYTWVSLSAAFPLLSG